MGRGAPGKAPLTYEGAYDAGRRYTPREVVVDSGHVFMALARTVGETPAISPSAWLLLGTPSTGSLHSDQGSTLPPLATYAAGSFFYLDTQGVEYVLTGTGGGAAATEDFNRSDGSIIGLTTTTGGLTWLGISAFAEIPVGGGNSYNAPLWSLSNKGSAPSSAGGGKGFVAIGDGAQQVAFDLILSFFVRSVGVWLRNSGTVNSGYYVEIKPTVSVKIFRGGPGGTLISTTTSGVPGLSATHAIIVAVDGSSTTPTITVTANGVGVVTFTDSTSVSGSNAGVIVEDNSVYIDNLNATGTGTLAWSYSRARFAPFTTALRPSAVSMGAGATYYDTTLSKPGWSDGSVWRDATGTAI